MKPFTSRGAPFPAHRTKDPDYLRWIDTHYSGNFQSGFPIDTHGHFAGFWYHFRYRAIILVIVPCLYMIFEDLAQAVKPQDEQKISA